MSNAITIPLTFSDLGGMLRLLQEREAYWRERLLSTEVTGHEQERLGALMMVTIYEELYQDIVLLHQERD